MMGPQSWRTNRLHLKNNGWKMNYYELFYLLKFIVSFLSDDMFILPGGCYFWRTMKLEMIGHCHMFVI